MYSGKTNKCSQDYIRETAIDFMLRKTPRITYYDLKTKEEHAKTCIDFVEQVGHLILMQD